MSIFKCKMCGGTIEFEQGATVGVCDSCGTKQTLPRLYDDRRANLYDRANHFRRNNEFDKAAAIYEQILTEDTTDAEAYWSLVLCQYGIEYVEDPATHKRVPTVNRAQFTSIFDDDNYRLAIQYADGYQRELYEKEAKTINDIQKGILAISQKEEPFDVFICYKETDNNGRRTPDSVLANDLYHQLVQEGFKVFFARITLEDKLGSAYEPYIFAALNSAKVMVVLGTKPEHFNAVWVKNEWSRYLALVKKSGGRKVLIPAYRDMDPYDLPEEFSHLQAQDMSKLGFMQDLIRGIKKIVGADEPKAAVKETVVVGTSNAGVAPLLERVFLFLEDGKWQDADIYCEKVLDIDPKNAEAYLGKLMAELHVRTREKLADCADPFDDRENYGKVLRFGDDKLEAEMRGYIAHINERNENARLTGIYSKAVSAMNVANTESEFKAAADTFRSISGFQDADALVEQCLDKAEVCRKNAIYASAHYEQYEQIKNSVAGCERAIKLYESISGWKDADEQIHACRKKIEEIKAKEKADRLERESQAEQKRIAAEKAAKKRKKVIAITTPIAVACIVFLIVLTTVIIPNGKYNNANGLLTSGDYEQAMDAFRELDYKDSYDKYCEAFISLKDEYRNKAMQYYNEGDKVNAAIWYRKAGDIEKADSIYNISSLVYTGEYISAGIMKDGSLKYQSDYEYDWGDAEDDLKGIAAFLQNSGTVVGVDSSGHLLTHKTGSFDNIDMKINSYYNNIVSIIYGGISTDSYYMVMLLSDGTLAETTSKGSNPYPDVLKWNNIKKIQEIDYCIYGIDTNGEVYQAIKTGCQKKYNVSGLKNVSKIIGLSDNLIVLSKEGTISVIGNSSYFSNAIDKKNNVQDIIYFGSVNYSGDGCIVLYNDGNVEMIVEPSDIENYAEIVNGYYKEISDEISQWNGIVSIQTIASEEYYGTRSGVIGIRYDGTVKYISTDLYYYSSDIYSTSRESTYKYDKHLNMRSELESWNDIVCISATSLASKYGRDASKGWVYAIGIRKDGTAISTGTGVYYTTEENSNGSGYHKSFHSEGTYNDVSSWKLW